MELRSKSLNECKRDSENYLRNYNRRIISDTPEIIRANRIKKVFITVFAFILIAAVYYAVKA